ncbi:hypothetical protein BJY16_002772 [Actinoplanes octamycinicus]|uniref:Uncharacterized protein n=1 Tax=Actinoplanes octamycinicus TaxID=135948 RepID=A0A7W7GW03_9ACTN|nr:hypothetical protein [Actinoplanes octamycinicus]MBB4739313.1 hypothetical protein [Actinoplanes octamycinicus]GIE58711.1 hypothetical protein Aoc01nite_41130 [Actinoplanes octamycinicus]
MQLPAAYVHGLHAVTRELHSARPDAPVVPARARRAARTRSLLARALYRVSAAVAPAGRPPEALFR